MNDSTLVYLPGTIGELRTLRNGTLTVPVVALQEGVIRACNASQPEYVPAATLADAPSRWNGKPVTRGHPTDHAGRQISANSPAVLATLAFGTIANARISNRKLCLDAVIDPVKAERIGAGRLLARLRAGEQIAVSVGCHVVTDPIAGSFGGKPYGAVWRALTPDHVSVLEHSEGACSVRDGCSTHRAASASADDFSPPDPYKAGIERLQREEAARTKSNYVPPPTALPLDPGGVPDAYATDLAKMRSENR